MLRHPRSSLVVLALVAGVTSCGADGGGKLTLVVEGGGRLPASPRYLLLNWLDGSGALFLDQRVPASGELPEREPVATIVVTVDRRGASPERRALVRAIGPAGLLGSASARIVVAGDGAGEVRLQLTPDEATDTDRDGVPDLLDNCPDANDLAGCSPPPPEADGGAEPLADAAPAPDAGADHPDAPPPGVDMDVDAAPGDDAGPVDAGGPAPLDARPSPPPPPTKPPTSPSGAAAAVASSPTGPDVHLTWKDNSSDEAEFEVERAPDVTGPWRAIGTSGPNTTLYKDKRLAPGTYHYRVRAVNVAGDSAPSNVATASFGVERKLSGTPFGTAPWSAGREFGRVWDGDTATFFDAMDPTNGHTGLDVGKSVALTRIRYFPRKDELDRMLGGKFQGSNVGSAGGFVDIHTITRQPSLAWVDVPLATPPAYRWYRYVGPPGGHTNIAEIELHTSAPP